MMRQKLNQQAKNKRKSEGGITLIALVITIIVLLILAGVSIAMLTGDNGLLSNASKSSTHTAYSSAEEQVKLAYMAVRAEIMSQRVSDGTYNATTANNTKKLAQVVEKDLSGSKWKVDGTTAGTIKIRYTDSAIDQGVIDNSDSANPQPRQEGKVDYTITLQAQNATVETDIAGLSIDENADNTPEEEETASTTYGISSDGKTFVGKKSTGKTPREVDNTQTANPTADGNGYTFAEGHFIYVTNHTYKVFNGFEYKTGNVYLCWDANDGTITTAEQRKSTDGRWDVYSPEGVWLSYGEGGK